MPEKRILLIDDQYADPLDLKPYFEKDYDAGLAYDFLYESGCIGEGENKVGSVEKAINGLKNAADVDLVLLDIMFPGDGNKYMGIEILKQIRAEYPILPVVMFTSLSRNEFKVFSESIENGANDFIGKGLNDFAQLKCTIETWLESDLRKEHAPKPLYGNSNVIKSLRFQIGKIAINSASRLKVPPPILITGETGTGKEVIANMIWRLGSRSEGPFQVVLCTGLPENLVESELFGHVKGAFTGADSDKDGLISKAQGGVLFFDEVGDLSSGSQARLLRAVQEHEIRKIGSIKTEYVDFQLIAATNKNLKKLISEGRFREDLYYRLTSGALIQAPCLRDYKEDIPLLAEMFLKSLSKTGKEKLSPSVLRVLRKHDYPGNVRELGSIITAALLNLGDSNTVYPEDLSPDRDVQTFIPNEFQSSQNVNSILGKSDNWAAIRLKNELQLAVAAKRKCKSTAEFMRKLYPEQSKQSTAAQKELVRRLTTGPWGDPEMRNNPDMAILLKKLEEN